LVEERHIKVEVLVLPVDVSGLHAQVENGRRQSIRTIVVNARHSGERQRFTLAHELGHLLLTVPDGRLGEKFCQRFASAFLMPAQLAFQEVGRRRRAFPVRELFRLKALFGVSAQAVAYRCRDLDIISETLFVSIFRQFGMRQWRKQEPNPIVSEKPLRFERLVIRALAENVIGEAKAAEFLGMSTWQLIEMLDSPPPEDGDDVDPAGL
jgi:Zn-dependent peptidase ImmA (M78 family)